MLHDLLAFIQFQLQTLNLTFSWLNFFEILFIAGIIFGFYTRFIKNTQSEKLVRGIVFLFMAWVCSEILIAIGLQIIGMFLKAMVALISLSLIVIFQPELRRFLGYLGQPGVMSMNFFKTSHHEEDYDTDIIQEVIEAVKYLSKTRTGALIVFQKGLSTGTFYDVGTKINAIVSTELILTIFHVNTPLHDGAMVIKDNKIVSAGVLLPLTEDPKLSWKYGTRHRAAIGMSEVADAACLVVSEETGDVSISLDGTLKKYEDLTTLKEDLENILGYKKEETDKKTIFNLSNLIMIRKTEDKKDAAKKQSK